MKKILVSALVLALPALASAQVQLMSGWNFGQFLGAGAPSMDGATFDTVGSIGANYTTVGGVFTAAPNSSSGDFVGNNALPGNYQAPAPAGRMFWDGTNGSSTYALDGIAIVSNDSFGPNSVNGATVNGIGSMAFAGDGLNQALTVTAGSLGILQDTSLFADTLAGTDLTFAASVASPVTVSFSVNGISAGSLNLSGSTMTAYSFNLPASFYGVAASQLVATFSGTASIDNFQLNGLSAIPEPSTYAALLAAATLGLMVYNRRKQQVAA